MKRFTHNYHVLAYSTLIRPWMEIHTYCLTTPSRAQTAYLGISGSPRVLHIRRLHAIWLAQSLARHLLPGSSDGPTSGLKNARRWPIVPLRLSASPYREWRLPYSYVRLLKVVVGYICSRCTQVCGFEYPHSIFQYVRPRGETSILYVVQRHQHRPKLCRNWF